MHLITLAEVNQNEKRLSQAVIQITQLLGIYHAELARILCLNCADIGDIAEGRIFLARNTRQWTQAEKFVLFFELLYRQCEGDEIAMCHWLRRHHGQLRGAPLYVMVDEGRIEDVLELMMASKK